MTLEKENKRLRNCGAALEAEQLGQQVAGMKVKYARGGVTRAQKKINKAIEVLAEHDCGCCCDGAPERALEILKEITRRLGGV